MATGLIERDTEIGALRGALAEAGGGHGRFALLEGPAGIGKTTLLGALCDEARRDGVPVLRARSSPLERDFPFGVVRQLFEPALMDEERRADLLAGAAEAAWSVLGPAVDDAAQGGSFAAL